jgi:hypothetical protein
MHVFFHMPAAGYTGKRKKLQAAKTPFQSMFSRYTIHSFTGPRRLRDMKKNFHVQKNGFTIQIIGLGNSSCFLRGKRSIIPKGKTVKK